LPRQCEIARTRTTRIAVGKAEMHRKVGFEQVALRLGLALKRA
jgi:hypothetical protein